MKASEMHLREINPIAFMQDMLKVRGDGGKNTIVGSKLWRFGNSWLHLEGDIVKGNLHDI